MGQQTQKYDKILSRFNNPKLVKEAGQKVVYEITHPKYGKVALKVGHYDTSGEKLQRLQREVNTLKKIDSEYYPKNFEFESYEDNTFLILEEFIESVPLAAKIKDYDNVLQALKLIRELVTALSLLWQRKIVHRDLKPDNILIRPNGKPVIIDLGMARILDMDTLTATGIAGPGTRAFAAPEQWKARRSEIDWRTDQFALGVILFMLVTASKHPFEGDVVGQGDLVANVLKGNWARTLVRHPGFEALEILIGRMVSVHPYERYKTPEILLAAIDECERSLS